MKRGHAAAYLAYFLTSAGSVTLGDGGYFGIEGEAMDLAQTRQEVLLAIVPAEGEDAGPAYRVTYVLRTEYEGEPSELAWVVPVPATPTDVLAHETGDLFDELNDATKPRFTVAFFTGGSGIGCFCFGFPMAGGDATTDFSLVDVEARGKAGIFEWAALTSGGGDALVDWLNENGFAVPTDAAEVLDEYIARDMHFLALRISEPDEIVLDVDGGIAIPPIQFTCETSELFYPMAISRISAAEETEVLIYALADHRMQGANVPNGIIDRDELSYDPDSPSSTNYESVFAQKVAELGAGALITEYARYGSASLVQGAWAAAPPGALDLMFLTRMRTVMSPEEMNLDFEFENAPLDDEVYPDFWIDGGSDVSLASVVGHPLAVLLLLGVFRVGRACRAARGSGGARP